MDRERKLSLAIARLEMDEAMYVYKMAKSVERTVLREEFELRISAHTKGLFFAVREVKTELGQLVKYVLKGLKLWANT